MRLRYLLLIALMATTPALAQPLMAPLVDPVDVADDDRIENWKGKSVLVFTPHPDDETFSMGGTLAILAENGNTINIVVFTNDDKGSKDLEMTSERLARIRHAEEVESCRILGINEDSIHWLGYEDGNLEYADPQRLRGEVARYIKLFKPDVVFTPDPGAKWVEWHKTDHRMAAQITKDAFIAAEWHLYYPQHLLDEGLKPHPVPLAYYYYSQEPNYEVDITEKFDQKIEASAAHVSQFEPSNSKYTPDMPKATYTMLKTGFSAQCKIDDRYVERFRREEMP